MYVDGFVTPVPKKNKQAYMDLARVMAPMFLKFGAVRVADCWQDDVERKEPTNFFGAVQAKEDEEVVLSWIEYPSKEVRDAAVKKMEQDPEMQEMWKRGPFEMKRMISGGFSSIMDISSSHS